MEIQYLLADNDLSETITVKFEHCSAIRIPINDKLHLDEGPERF